MVRATAKQGDPAPTHPRTHPRTPPALRVDCEDHVVFCLYKERKVLTLGNALVRRR